MFIQPVYLYGYDGENEDDVDGLGGFFKSIRKWKIGKTFKRFGINIGRVASAGLWDPAKNRFFVPFSSGHMRTLGKGIVGVHTGGLVNADKFFDSRTMRTIGTVVGAGAGVVVGAVAAPAVMSGAGGMLSSGMGILKNVGTGLQVFQTGSKLLGGGLFGGGGAQQPQEQQVTEIAQTGYPTLVNPVGMYPPPIMPYNPYSYNPYVPMSAYQYSDSVAQKAPETYKAPEVRTPVIKRETLPGGVEITTISGFDEIVNSFGVPVKYH
jgi:hypothetical protein